MNLIETTGEDGRGIFGKEKNREDLKDSAMWRSNGETGRFPTLLLT